MRILINDFGGYPFPIQLSKYLAENNFDVMHTYIANIKTPHGNMEGVASAQGSFQVVPIYLKEEFKKYSIIGRYKGELEFSRKLVQVINTFNPDIVFSANTPLLAQSKLLKECKRKKIKFIYWCQDIHSIAIENFFKKRRLFFGKYLVNYFRTREVKLLQNSDHIIAISDEFKTVFEQWHIATAQISVIHNWGPIDEISIRPKSNKWAKNNSVDTKIVILYTGTLGLKHNPLLIVNAANKFKYKSDVLFLVISEGTGAEILKERIKTDQINNLKVLPYQDYSLLSDVLGSADILLSILEKDAAVFSVPSKVLTYLCAKKPLLLSVPSTNLSAKIVVEANAGLCAEPDHDEDFFNKLLQLVDDLNLRNKLSANGRKYAEEHFPIPAIAQSFIKVINELKS